MADEKEPDRPRARPPEGSLDDADRTVLWARMRVYLGEMQRHGSTSLDIIHLRDWMNAAETDLHREKGSSETVVHEPLDAMALGEVALDHGPEVKFGTTKRPEPPPEPGETG